MSEMQAVNAKGVDTPTDWARKSFAARYVRIGAILLVIVTAVWLATVLGTWALGSPDYFSLSGIAVGLAYVLAWAWFVALIVVTHRRTGLVWCIITGGARFNILFLPPFMIGAVVLAWALDLAGIVRSIVVGLAIYIGAYGPSWVLDKLVSPRDEIEAAAYGGRWLKLADVTVRDILLFRIPHERA